MSAAFPAVAGRILKLLWRGARATRSVRRGRTFAQEMVKAAHRLEQSGDFNEGMTDREIARELERMGVGFGSSAVSRPTADQFLNGPTETRESHYK